MNKRINNLWRSVVREAEIIGTHPGYRYKFFTGFAEANRYMIQQQGEEWLKEPWAVYFHRSVRPTKDNPPQGVDFIKSSDVIESGSGKITNIYTRNPDDYRYILLHYLKKGYSDPDKLKILLESRPERYRVNKQELITLIDHMLRKYGIKNSNPDKYIVVELIKFYRGKGLSSRKISHKLAEQDNIFVSYRHIQRLVPELFKGEDDVD